MASTLVALKTQTGAIPMSAKKAQRVSIDSSTNGTAHLQLAVFEIFGDLFSRENKPHTTRWTASEVRDLAARMETVAMQLVSAAAEAEYVTARNELRAAFFSGAIPDSAPPATAPVQSNPLRMRSVQTYGKGGPDLPVVAYSGPMEERHKPDCTCRACKLDGLSFCSITPEPLVSDVPFYRDSTERKQ